MASVNSKFRKLLKPLIYKVLGPRLYQHFQYRAKWRDIELKLVEEPEMALLPKFLRKDDISIDVGANFAYYSVRLAELSPQGKIIAYEPIPGTYEICQKLLDKAGARNVQLFQKGVGAENTKVEFEVPLQEIGTHSAGQAHMKGRDNSLPGKEIYHPFTGKETFLCEIVKLDELELPRLRFVKIDIEGAELWALQGMRKLLKKHKPLLFIEICEYFLKGFGIQLPALLSEIESLGYEVYELAPGGEKIQKAAIPPARDKNYILLHKDMHREFGAIL